MPSLTHGQWWKDISRLLDLLTSLHLWRGSPHHRPELEELGCVWPTSTMTSHIPSDSVLSMDTKPEWRVVKLAVGGSSLYDLDQGKFWELAHQQVIV